MPTICPKCRHVRQPDETAPEWQCPACGVAYVKAEEAARGESYVRAGKTHRIDVAESRASSVPWTKLMLVAMLAWGCWTGIQMAKEKHTESQLISATVGGEVSAAGLAELAATIKSSDVVMYSTTECTYCAQAKSWLNQYGFAFSECNMSVDAECERQFKSYGATGTPYLVVRGHHMKDGFDSDEFLALLSR